MSDSSVVGQERAFHFGSQAGWELSLNDNRQTKETEFMLYSLTMLLLLDPSAGLQPPHMATAKSLFPFDSYTQAYREAQRTKKPLLVILNPSEESEAAPIHWVDVRKTDHRRKLLDRYVVVVLNPDTDHGKAVHKIFSNQPLPHVAVVDRDQRFQVFRTSRKLQGEDWNKILETFQHGDSTAYLNLDVQKPCPT